MLIPIIVLGSLLFLVAFVIGVSLGRAAAVSLPHCAPHLITLPCRRCLEGEPEEQDEPYDAAAWDREITAMLEAWKTYDAEWRMQDSKYTP